MSEKQLQGIAFRVEPVLGELYAELTPGRKRRVKNALIRDILKHHAEQQFDVREYAKKHGVSIEDTDE